MVEACRQRARPTDRIKSIDVISIPTGNRAPAFARCARSYLSNARNAAKIPELVVADDSTDPVVRDEYKRLLRSITKEFGTPAYYIGEEEKRTYVNHLCKRLPEYRSVIEFALLDPLGIGHRPGANRNALLIHNVGRPFLCVDDDTVCKLSSFASNPGTLQLTDAYDPTSVLPYENEEILEEHLRFVEADILGEHEKILGRDIGSLLIERPHTITNIRNPEIQYDISENALNIAISWLGIAGDCGFAIPAFLFDLAEDPMKYFTRNEISYEEILRNRQIARFCSSLTVTPGGFCQSTAAAFDNRLLLPPFLPVLRGQDLLFGQILKMLFPNTGIGYLPLGILHLPQEVRESSRDDLVPTLQHHSPIGLIQALLRLAAGSSASKDTVKSVALLKEAAAVVNSDFFEMFAINYQRSELGSRLNALIQQSLKYPENPTYWKRDVEAQIRHLNKTIGLPLVRFPNEFIRNVPEERRLSVFKDIILLYFQLIEAWPLIARAAFDLKHRNNVSIGKLLD